MNILVITNTTPYPTISGGRLRVYNLLKRIAQHHQVWLASHLHSHDEQVDFNTLGTFCQEVVTGTLQRQSPVAHIPGLLRYALKGIPPELKFLYSEELASKIQRLIQQVPFDLIQIEESALAPYIELVPHGPKRVLTFYDIDFTQAARIASIKSSARARFRMRLYGRMMRRWEPTYAEHFDRCITVSEIDRDLLKNANPRLLIEVVANGVDTGCYQPLPHHENPAIMFVGSMNYAPCIDAMLHFAHDILPRILPAFPNLKLFIVGANPAPEICALENDTIHVTGRVEDVRPYYEQCPVVVVPLRAGGGTRLKILEAMAFGRAVVSTPLGAEGLDVRHDEHLLLADAPDTFAAHIINLLQDYALYARLTTAARAQVEAHYDWNIIASQMLRIYEEVAL